MSQWKTPWCIELSHLLQDNSIFQQVVLWSNTGGSIHILSPCNRDKHTHLLEVGSCGSHVKPVDRDNKNMSFISNLWKTLLFLYRDVEKATERAYPERENKSTNIFHQCVIFTEGVKINSRTFLIIPVWSSKVTQAIPSVAFFSKVTRNTCRPTCYLLKIALHTQCSIKRPL